MDSSTELAPSMTTPSTGIFSPGRTRSRSPTWIASRLTSCSEPLDERRRAVFGASPSRAVIAPLVRLRAFQFQDLAKENKHDDHDRRLEVQVELSGHIPEGGREELRQDDGHKTVQISGAGPDGD